MIPVRQTRFAVETAGNCFEACIASILEVPITAIPDRADFIGDPDAWADLVHRTRLAGGDKAVGELPVPWADAWETALKDWLEYHGLGWIRYTLDACSKRDQRVILEMLERDHRGYWIGSHLVDELGEWSHAVVYRGATLVHNPWAGEVELGKLVDADVFTAADPARIARTLGPELLPDVAGRIDSLDPDFRGRMVASELGQQIRAGQRLTTGEMVFADGSWTR